MLFIWVLKTQLGKHCVGLWCLEMLHIQLHSYECRLLLGVLLQVGLICVHSMTVVLVLGNVYKKSVFLSQFPQGQE